MVLNEVTDAYGGTSVVHGHVRSPGRDKGAAAGGSCISQSASRQWLPARAVQCLRQILADSALDPPHDRDDQEQPPDGGRGPDPLRIQSPVVTSAQIF